jgi:acetyltransferase-like isoleucine patch superfamily enzyme
MNLRRILHEVQIRLADEYRRAELFRREGAEIGLGCRLLITTLGSEPYLVSIGDETLVSGGVKFLTHDAGTWVFRVEHPEAGRFGRISVGSRAFIGANAIILAGVTIGDRSIVGAGAVVTKDVPPGVVVAGVPARVVTSVADYARRTLRDFPSLEEPPPGADRSEQELRRQLEMRYPKR